MNALVFVLLALVASAAAAPPADSHPASAAAEAVPAPDAKDDPAPVAEAGPAPSPKDEPAPVTEAEPAPVPKDDAAPLAKSASPPALLVAAASVATPIAIAPRSAAQTESKEPIAIVSQESELNPDGSWVNKYETANGISFAEESSLKTLEKGEIIQVVKGVISYPAPDGTIIETTYTADEDGFHASGAHLPVGPEIPAYIAKSLEWSAAHPEEDVEEIKKKL